MPQWEDRGHERLHTSGTPHVAIPLAIELLAYIASTQGDLDRSARLAGYADASLARIGFAREDESLAV